MFSPGIALGGIRDLNPTLTMKSTTQIWLGKGLKS